MKKLYRKICIGVITVLLLVTTFSASTYAWFKINSDANITGFDFQVTGGEGFLVSIDGVNYSNDLTATQMKQAIILGYDNINYQLKDGKIVNLNDIEVDMDSVLKKISLLPLTSKDGINLVDLYNSASTIESGRYMEFSIYFKSATANDEKIAYNIYLLGEDKTLDDGTVVNKTSISSVPTTVQLKADMNTIYGDYGLNYPTKTVGVYSSNALRMSIQDTSLETPSATIYELSDNRSDDLGSYATNYDKATYVAQQPANYATLSAEEQAKIDAQIAWYNALTQADKDELDKLYNCDTNAMYTYYNNLRPSSKLTPYLLKFDERPLAYRSLDTVITENTPKVTTVESGKEAKKVTFRFWLEGWDADCFDGLANAIKVKLSFTSTKEDISDESNS